MYTKNVHMRFTYNSENLKTIQMNNKEGLVKMITVFRKTEYYSDIQSHILKVNVENVS